MWEYMVKIKNKDLWEKIVFIFYIFCELDDFMLYLILLLIFGKIKYFEGCFDKIIVKILFGWLFNCIENIKLFENVFL